MKTPSGMFCSFALVVCVTGTVSARGPESVHPVRVDSGWNLLSLPASVSNGSRTFLFPSAVSGAYAFRDGGYREQDTIQNGMGFWLKFDSAQTVLIQGLATVRDTIDVQSGWNIIGSLSLPLAVDSIRTSPPGIVTGQIFDYMPGTGYRQADSLEPGRGYWVKLTQAGSFVLASPGGLPCPGTQTVDYGGKTYHTVQIGSQCWLRENLDVGAMIGGPTNQTDNGIVEKYCYDNEPANCLTYGALYQWGEAMQYDSTESAQGICPPGWHVPTLAGFQLLRATVDGDGNALKAVGQGSGAGTGTNTSGFSALLAGDRVHVSGSFSGLGLYAFAWSSTQYDASFAFYLNLVNIIAAIDLFSGIKNYGLSVRCVQN